MSTTHPAPAPAYDAQFHKVSFAAPFVLHISFNRPPVNAFHESFWMETQRLFERASNDPDVRAIVLSAEGKMFTAGLDVTAAGQSLFDDASGDAARQAFRLRKHILDFQASISSIEKCLKPVVVAMHGLVLGLGIDIASACDIRYAAAGTRFTIKEVDIGLAADIGTLQRFPKVVGNGSWARELALTAREFDAHEARQFGFVSRVVVEEEQGRPGVLAAAVETAKLIASKSPVSVVGTKHLINYSRDHSVDEGLSYTAVWNSAMIQTEDVASALTSVLQRKKPTFSRL